MFTGLIREIGTLQRTARRAGMTELQIAAPGTAPSLKLGDSVAVDGMCLTVTREGRRAFTVEASAETRRLTTLGDWRSGRRVHLEPALRAGDALDGHLVQGHVDGTGRVLRLTRGTGTWDLTVGLPPELARFLTPRGSVAIDGVSLTVDEGPFVDRFTVNLIPHTVQQTHFDRLRTGQRVNLEMDVLVKAARTGAAWDAESNAPVGGAERPAAGLTLERLLAHGFGRLRGRS